MGREEALGTGGQMGRFCLLVADALASEFFLRDGATKSEAPSTMEVELKRQVLLCPPSVQSDRMSVPLHDTSTGQWSVVLHVGQLQVGFSRRSLGGAPR